MRGLFDILLVALTTGIHLHEEARLVSQQKGLIS